MKECRNLTIQHFKCSNLIQTCYLPSLLCSCETFWYLSSCDEKRVDVSRNNAFRKIFNAYWRECQTVGVLLLLSLCIHLVTHEETVILEENAV